MLAALELVRDDSSEPAPAPTAGHGKDAGTLYFSILDETGRVLSARLTFIGEDGPGAELFPNADAVLSISQCATTSSTHSRDTAR